MPRGRNEVAHTRMVTPCFLIVHPRGTLMWDTGEIPDSAFKDGVSPPAMAPWSSSRRRGSSTIMSTGLSGRLRQHFTTEPPLAKSVITRETGRVGSHSSSRGDPAANRSDSRRLGQTDGAFEIKKRKVSMPTNAPSGVIWIAMS